MTQARLLSRRENRASRLCMKGDCRCGRPSVVAGDEDVVAEAAVPLPSLPPIERGAFDHSHHGLGLAKLDLVLRQIWQLLEALAPGTGGPTGR
jgi:hypothetical protein